MNCSLHHRLQRCRSSVIAAVKRAKEGLGSAGCIVAAELADHAFHGGSGGLVRSRWALTRAGGRQSRVGAEVCTSGCVLRRRWEKHTHSKDEGQHKYEGINHSYKLTQRLQQAH